MGLCCDQSEIDTDKTKNSQPHFPRNFLTNTSCNSTLPTNSIARESLPFSTILGSISRQEEFEKNNNNNNKYWHWVKF